MLFRPIRQLHVRAFLWKISTYKSNMILLPLMNCFS
uniref:Uncharacterized protein n=1 Tax=Arundo donax TaxID=35708 RepID=A0A0A8ZH91_ARUDO